MDTATLIHKKLLSWLLQKAIIWVQNAFLSCFLLLKQIAKTWKMRDGEEEFDMRQVIGHVVK